MSGRRRPWRLVSVGTSYDEDPDDTELSVAATGLTKLGNERAFDRLDRWMNERGSYPREWQHAWFSQNNISYLMPRRTQTARRRPPRGDPPLPRSHRASRAAARGLSTGEHPRVRIPDSADALRQLAGSHRSQYQDRDVVFGDVVADHLVEDRITGGIGVARAQCFDQAAQAGVKLVGSPFIGGRTALD